jgi:hypothetical protein
MPSAVEKPRPRLTAARVFQAQIAQQHQQRQQPHWLCLQNASPQKRPAGASKAALASASRGPSQRQQTDEARCQAETWQPDCFRVCLSSTGILAPESHSDAPSARNVSMSGASALLNTRHCGARMPVSVTAGSSGHGTSMLLSSPHRPASDTIAWRGKRRRESAARGEDSRKTKSNCSGFGAEKAKKQRKRDDERKKGRGSSRGAGRPDQ